MRTVPRAAITVAIVLLVSSCVHKPKDQLEESVGPTKQALTDPADGFYLPLDSFDLSDAEQALIDNAQELLTKNCMQALGYSWPVLNHSPLDELPRNSRRYGITDLVEAQDWGYRLNSRQVKAVADRSNRSETMPPDEKSAASGTDGCENKAYRALNKGIEDVDFGRWNDMNKDSYEASQDSDTVKDVIQSWSACIQKKGYHYISPLAAIDDRKWATSEPATEMERKAASADVECKASVNLVITWSDTETQIQNKEINANQDYFDSLMKHRLSLVKAAQRVMESQHSTGRNS